MNFVEFRKVPGPQTWRRTSLIFWCLLWKQDLRARTRIKFQLYKTNVTINLISSNCDMSVEVKLRQIHCDRSGYIEKIDDTDRTK